MRVLVAFEESQMVCIAFREKGHEAYSCDIQECSGGHPEWHINGNVLDLLNPDYTGSARKPDQIYNPYDFKVETECKKTCLWLKGLELLKTTQVLPKEQRTQGIWKAQFDGKQYSWNDPETAKLRSKHRYV